MASPAVVLPGDTISPEALPHSSTSRKLKLGPGLQIVAASSTIKATACGALSNDNKKNLIWIESNGGRYIPQAGDLIIATVHHTSADYYHCIITPYTTPAGLPVLSFESATRKTRPHLANGALVYARIASASKHSDPELECVHPSTGKADGLGPLKGGMVFDVSVGFARRLMAGRKGGVVLLDEVAKHVEFEVAIGRNGRVWVNAGEEKMKLSLALGRALQEVDEKGLTVEEQREVLKRMVKSD